MSLRVFHVVFIVASVALAFFVSVWGVREFMNTRSMLGIGMAIFAFAGGASLVWYGTHAMRKFKELP
jgi:hypothetical protein